MAAIASGFSFESTNTDEDVGLVITGFSDGYGVTLKLIELENTAPAAVSTRM